MSQSAPFQSRIGRYARRCRNVAVALFAAIGLIWVLHGPVLTLLGAALFDRDITRAIWSPDRAAVAEVEVTRGPATVWTTRVRLHDVGQEGWVVYSNRDSRFAPPLRWSGPDTLVIGLPCDAFDHASNPDDGARSRPGERRLRVRFEYPQRCAMGG